MKGAEATEPPSEGFSGAKMADLFKSLTESGASFASFQDLSDAMAEQRIDLTAIKLEPRGALKLIFGDNTEVCLATPATGVVPSPEPAPIIGTPPMTSTPKEELSERDRKFLEAVRNSQPAPEPPEARDLRLKLMKEQFVKPVTDVPEIEYKSTGSAWSVTLKNTP